MLAGDLVLGSMTDTYTIVTGVGRFSIMGGPRFRISGDAKGVGKFPADT